MDIRVRAKDGQEVNVLVQRRKTKTKKEKKGKEEGQEKENK